MWHRDHHIRRRQRSFPIPPHQTRLTENPNNSSNQLILADCRSSHNPTARVPHLTGHLPARANQAASPNTRCMKTKRTNDAGAGARRRERRRRRRRRGTKADHTTRNRRRRQRKHSALHTPPTHTPSHHTHKKNMQMTAPLCFMLAHT